MTEPNERLTIEQLVEVIEDESEAEAGPKRSVAIGLVVDKPRELPDAAYNIAEFTNILREQIGEFDSIEIGVQVNPRGAEVKERQKFMGFVATDNGGDDGSDDDDEDDHLGDDDEEMDMRTLH